MRDHFVCSAGLTVTVGVLFIPDEVCNIRVMCMCAGGGGML